MKTGILIVAAALLLWAADQATLDRGQKEAAASCAPCHSLRLVQSQRLSKATWNKEIDKMVGWGAKVQDRDALVEYLVTNYGDDKPASPPAMSKDGATPKKKQN
jgi:mono/diheme cytochrome c family protein